MPVGAGHTDEEGGRKLEIEDRVEGQKEEVEVVVVVTDQAKSGNFPKFNASAN